jgi:spermidine synthase
MACLPRRPDAVAVICFGMGTTFRSMASWGVDTTAVELVPGVKEMFGFFHPDGPALERDPRFRVVIDDGRRFLMRTRKRFDVITVDPPPPVEAASSSLLYSAEFYELAKSRLMPGGILAQWYPEGDIRGGQSTLRALVGVFPHVRAFRPWMGLGVHLLASEHEIVLPDEAAMRARMPPGARADLVEWGRPRGLREFARGLPGLEVDVLALLDPDAGFVLTDDRPRNEYYLVRRFRRWITGAPQSPAETRWPWPPAP